MVAVEMPVLVEAGVRSSARAWASLLRARRVDGGSGSDSTIGGGGLAWICGTKGGGVVSIGEEDVDVGSAISAWESVSSEGVSSPRRSSPSDESSSLDSNSPSWFLLAFGRYSVWV